MQPSGPRAGDGGRAGGAPRPSSAADEVPLVPAPAPSAAAAGDPASLPVAAAVAADGDDDGGCDAPRPLLLPATPQRLEFAGVSLELDVARARGGAGARKSGGGGGVGATAGGVAPPRRRLLWDVTGAALPCHLTAVMGATGSGKTSLMNMLRTREPPAPLGRVALTRTLSTPHPRSLARRLVRSPRLHPSGRVTGAHSAQRRFLLSRRRGWRTVLRRSLSQPS